MKSEIVFALENASWPALMVDSTGVIRRVNEAAQSVFGPVLREESSRLSAIWSPENSVPADQFVSRLEISLESSMMLKFLIKGGTQAIFMTHICPTSTGQQKYFVLQLFRESVAPAGQTSFIGKPGAVDAGAAHKQKLDCALQLTRTVALDFNNALTSILGHTSLLLRKLEPGNPWRNSLLEVEKSAEKAAEIAHDLAVFSRQEKDARAQVAGNLNDLLRRVVELFRPPAWPAAEWKLHLESKLYTVNIDEAKMQQAFMKILENALQAVGPEGRIMVVTRNRDLPEPTTDGNIKIPAGCFVCVEVSDNGVGIAPEVLPRIFEPFFTTKQGHRGLGLAWVYGIMTNHGGTIAVSSQPGQGTSIRVYLPALKKIVKDKNYRDDELRGSQKILVVDDEDLLLTMAEMILSSFGYKVLTANSGQKALDVVTSLAGDIDLIITDLVMPVMSGRELIEKLQIVAPHIPIICSTGYVRSSREEEQGIYLQKPFTSQDLLLKVKHVLHPGDQD